MSADSYQPFAFAPVSPQNAAELPAAVTDCHRAVPALSPPENGFSDWGKGAEFREFQRQREQTVTTVTTFSGNLPWTGALNRLAGIRKPSSMRAEAWEVLLFDCHRFVEQWGLQALQFGWTELELFGCNVVPEARRLDSNGLVVSLHGRRVRAMDDRKATIESGPGETQSFYRGFPLSNSIPMWLAFSQEGGP